MTKFFSLLFLVFYAAMSIGQQLSEKELSSISNAIKDKKIIGLGEPDHFFTGYYDVKIQVIKYLITHHQIDAIALEASSIECRKLDAYIKGTDVDLYKTLPDLNAGFKYEKKGIFDCKQIVDFLQWLRAENKNRKNKIYLFGIGFQNIETPIQNLKKYFSNSISFHQQLDTIRNNLYSLMKQFSDDPMKIYFDSTWKQKAINNYELSERIINYVSKKDKDKWIQQNAKELNQFSYIFTNPNLQRDKLMYENFVWHFNGRETTLIWAANAHIANDSIVNKISKMLTLGAYLSQNYGNQYFTIALINDQDPLESDRIVYPIKDDKLAGKYDFLIKCQPGQPAIRLEDQSTIIQKDTSPDIK